MKLILFQYRPAIRLYKYAETLIDIGHDITIANTGRTLNGLKFPVPIRHIDEIDINSYHAFLSFNPSVLPDNIHIPIVQCVGDLKSYDRKFASEISNLRQCGFAIFISNTQLYQAMILVPELKDKSTVIYNGLVPSLVPDRLRTKLKSKGKLTAVWSGTLSDNVKDKRFLAPLFEKYSTRFDLHVYPSYVPFNHWAYDGNYTLHKPVPPQKLVYELSQYDIGLILWHDITDELTASLPNKYFEYLAAGLQVVHNYKRPGEITRQPDVKHIDEKIERIPQEILIRGSYQEQQNVLGYGIARAILDDLRKGQYLFPQGKNRQTS
jgi:hypothetical protein